MTLIIQTVYLCIVEAREQAYIVSSKLHTFLLTAVVTACRLHHQKFKCQLLCHKRMDCHKN